ncbi:MAG: nucleotidyl transferase AbiEii/AbiGii toxin family protein [Sphingomonas sp.]
MTISIFDHFRRANNFTPRWSFGGGTALMLMIDHRESHDIDIFLDDARSSHTSIRNPKAMHCRVSPTATRLTERELSSLHIAISARSTSFVAQAF